MPTTMGHDLYMSALVDHEKAMAQLYLNLGRFAADEKQRALWNRLAEEETAQAKLIEDLRVNGEEYGLELTHKRPKTSDVMRSTSELITVTEKIAAKGIKDKDGLELAKRFEMEYVEQKVFGAFATDNSELLGYIMTTRMLNEQHPEHLEAIATMIRKRAFSFSKLFGLGESTPTNTEGRPAVDIIEDDAEGQGTVRMRILPNKGDIKHIQQAKPVAPPSNRHNDELN